MIVKAVRLGRVDNNALIDFLKAHEKTQVVSAGCVAGEAHVGHGREDKHHFFNGASGHG